MEISYLTQKLKNLPSSLRYKIFGRRTFEFFQSLGINVIPDHFYSSIPNIKKLKNSQSWRKPYSLIGINGIDLDKQLQWMRTCCSEKNQEILISKDIHLLSCQENEYGFGKIEADFLYCFISSFQPKKIIQIGCGVSTKTILMAANDSKYKVNITCIDPYPTLYLLEKSRHSEINLISKEAQEVSLDILTNIGENDLFFVDSTHTIKPGSEVNRIILEVLPRLKKGTFVHFHDIYFPYDYHPEILTKQIYFWNESILLQAYLTNNPKYEIKASMSMLHYYKQEKLKELLPNYEPHESNEYGLFVNTPDKHFPASIYLQVIGLCIATEQFWSVRKIKVLKPL